MGERGKVDRVSIGVVIRATPPFARRVKAGAWEEGREGRRL